MEYKFGRESTKSMIENYYKKYYDVDGKLEFITTTFCGKKFIRAINNFLDIESTVSLGFELNGKMKVSDGEEDFKMIISHSHAKEAIKAMLIDSGYKVKNIVFDCEPIKNKNSVPEFNGIIVDMSTKKKVK